MVAWQQLKGAADVCGPLAAYGVSQAVVSVFPSFHMLLAALPDRAAAGPEALREYRDPAPHAIAIRTWEKAGLHAPETVKPCENFVAAQRCEIALE